VATCASSRCATVPIAAAVASAQSNAICSGIESGSDATGSRDGSAGIDQPSGRRDQSTAAGSGAP
jgi:hypothetical protein